MDILVQGGSVVMKKAICGLLVICMCLCVSGCELFEFAKLTTEYVADNVSETVNKVVDSFAELEEDNKYLDELGAEIVRCLDEKDAEGLKALFCANELESNTEIDSQIENAFSMYEGKSQSFYVTDKSWEGGRRDGVYIDKYFTPRIREIITDAGKTYYIKCLLYTVCDYDIGKIGISAIGLYDECTDNKIARIG